MHIKHLAAVAAATCLAFAVSACESDYYGRGDYRGYRHWRHQEYQGHNYYYHPQRNCWYAPPDRDDNPPGPRGGPGTNWENPPGPAGGPGASPDVNRCR